jgi:hypothetical protein
LSDALGLLEDERKSSETDLETVGEPGFYLDVEFKASEKDKVLQSLENLASKAKIELMSVSVSPRSDEYLEATLFVPDSKKDYFEDKITAYENEQTKSDKPKNEPLVSRIEAFSLSPIISLFTDENSLFPLDQSVALWWEVWLRGDRKENFDTIAQRLNIRVQPHSIKFVEREVVLTLASVVQLGQILRKCDAIAELKMAKDMPSLFFENNDLEQQAWMNDLVDRCVFDRSTTVSVCLLDSGVTRNHPLLEHSLSEADMDSCEPAWTLVDDSGHGTNMAGLALYSDLCDALVTQREIHVSHCLESVKMLPPIGQNDPALYGWITQECISRAEVNAPLRQRVICMAVTSEGPNRGTPSSWSAAMRKHLPAAPQQKDKSILLRRYGYGVPSLDKALRSAKNDLTMIVEDGFQPFQKKDGSSSVTTKDMNLHTLPWPKKELEALGERDVEMRVTVSYFIESNPGDRGWVRRYSYPAYGLRFKTKDATERLVDFQKRISKDAHEDGDIVSFKEDTGWFLGNELRNRGSLHSDSWTGTAADLAAKDAIGVYPVGGWWKERPTHNRWAESVRYALIVSIRVMGEGADIYTPVATLVRQTLAIEVET